MKYLLVPLSCTEKVQTKKKRCQCRKLKRFKKLNFDPIFGRSYVSRLRTFFVKQKFFTNKFLNSMIRPRLPNFPAKESKIFLCAVLIQKKNVKIQQNFLLQFQYTYLTRPSNLQDGLSNENLFLNFLKIEILHIFNAYALLEITKKIYEKYQFQGIFLYQFLGLI